jgi:hypothetical protein
MSGLNYRQHRTPQQSSSESSPLASSQPQKAAKLSGADALVCRRPPGRLYFAGLALGATGFFAAAGFAVAGFGVSTGFAAGSSGALAPGVAGIIAG